MAIVNDFLVVGVQAAHLDARTPKAERREIVTAFKAGKIQLLSSVGVLTTGFDAPIAECAILARPTLSLALHIQQLGRVMRIHEGKTSGLVLDHAGNFSRHGSPELFELHSLSDKEIESRRKVNRKTRVMQPCKSCGFMLESNAFECPKCGHERRRVNRVSYRPGTLINLKSGQPATDEIDPKRFYLELRSVERLRGYSSKWAAMQYKSRYESFPPWAWSDLAPLDPSPSTLRYVRASLIRFKKKQERVSA